MSLATPLSLDLARAIASIPLPASETPFRAHLDTLTKPLGSLGRLEDLAAQLGSLGITTLQPSAWIFAADHGIAAEGVSAYPSEVTFQMVLNFLYGGAAVNVLARLHQVPVHVINAGVQQRMEDRPGLRNAPVRLGSRNMLYESAMSPEELAAVLTLGLDCAQEARLLGCNLVVVGEMGIGNTTSASALTANLTGAPVAEVTGRGTGLNDASYARKLAVLEAVLARVQPGNAQDLLAEFGGLEIAAMAGFMIGCASHGIAVLLDGFISTAAAAIALQLAPALRPWLFAGHQSQEPGHCILLRKIGLQPILQLEMRLGEGSGALLALPILRSALALYHQMATFAGADVSVASL